jgi:DNA end-binding protein Ku
VLALIERKAQGKKIAVQPAAEEIATPAPDLMSALKASLDAVRAREGDGPAPRKAAQSGESAGGTCEKTRAQSGATAKR